MNKKPTHILKASGEMATFQEEKLRRSLSNSGADKEDIERIVNTIKDNLYEGITSKEIYKKAFSLLQESPGSVAARYKLKNAIMELGPTGYPFEVLVSELLRSKGYHVQVGAVIQGHCVQHEVDVIADKDDHRYMVECKFHNDHATNCDVKIPLYIYSRFKDIEAAWKTNKKNENRFHQGWIFTNTRFSDDAIQYGECMGLKLIGWDYPKKGNLKDRIDYAGLHPITSLTTITIHEKKKLLEQNKVLCKDLKHYQNLLKQIGIEGQRKKKVLKEVEDLCKSH